MGTLTTIILTILIVLAIVFGLRGMIQAQNEVYSQRKTFVDKCVSVNGVYSEAQIDWSHIEMICTPIATTSKQ